MRYQRRTTTLPISTTLNFTDFSSLCRIRPDHSFGMSSMMSNTGTQSRAIFSSRPQVRRASLPWNKKQSSRQKRQSVSPRSCSSALSRTCQVLLPLTEPLLNHSQDGRRLSSRYMEPKPDCGRPDVRDSSLIPALEAYEQFRF